MTEAVSPVSLRRKILAALIDNEEGMTVAGIAALIGRRRKEVREELTSLRIDEEVIIDRINHHFIAVWVVTFKGQKGFNDQRFAAKERKCLTCQKPFWSSHAGNRICPLCTEDIEESGPGDQSWRGGRDGRYDYHRIQEGNGEGRS